MFDSLNYIDNLRFGIDAVRSLRQCLVHSPSRPVTSAQLVAATLRRVSLQLLLHYPCAQCSFWLDMGLLFVS